MSINILHLTDIHIGNDNFPYDTVKEFALSICEFLEDKPKKIDLIVITGDIFTGKKISKKGPELSNDACLFFEYLLERINKLSNPHFTKEDFLFIPGNHDIDRKNIDNPFNTYRNFLLRFYGSANSAYSLYDKDFLYRIKIFETEKFIVLGLNSCRFEHYSPIDSDFDWVKELSFDSISSPHNDAIKENIEKHYKVLLSSKYYDYGFISREQLTSVYDKLSDSHIDYKSYITIAAFHHHFYPFPEILSKQGDTSLLRDYERVIDRLIKFNTKLILHGHKHIPLIRPIVTDDSWGKQPIFAIAGGDIGNKNSSRHFQLIEAFNDNTPSICNLSKYTFIGDKLGPLETFAIPPSPREEETLSKKITEILKMENIELYNYYINEISDRDIISNNTSINNVIINISKVFTSFAEVKEKLTNNNDELFLILLFVHYKVNSMNVLINKGNDLNIRSAIRLAAKKVIHEQKFIDLVFNYLDNLIDSQAYYELLSKSCSTLKQKRIKSIAVICSLFTELNLTLLTYADFYYQKFSHLVNITLHSDVFHQQIPRRSIAFDCFPDRRTVIINFIAKDPTCHKIAALFIKIFENSLSKYGDDFDELSLKIYYIRPNVEKSNNYDLEDHNFEAYIPNLLPLLIGENLYKQKEVFIRELIQNSIDAVLLRTALSYKGIEKEQQFDKTIKITFGKGNTFNLNNEQREEKFFISIEDNGTGMTPSQVERYLIHIARSYYDSNEYRELAKKMELNYKPISKFGIGFLSSFLYANEINVETKSYIDTENSIYIHIPNHEGCFFSKINNYKKSTGTKITLFKSSKSNITIDNILKYITTCLLDIPLNLEIVGVDENNNQINVFHKSFSLRNNLAKSNQPSFFVPINNIGKIVSDQSNAHEPYGITVQYTEKFEPFYFPDDVFYIEMNGGILLNDGTLDKNRLKNYFTKIYFNYPPGIIELDVTREKIIDFHNVAFKQFKNDIVNCLYYKINDWIKNEILYKSDTQIITIYRLLHFLKLNGLSETENHFYSLFITFDKNRVKYNFKFYEEAINPDSDSLIFKTPYDIPSVIIRNLNLFSPILLKSIKIIDNILPFEKAKLIKQLINELYEAIHIPINFIDGIGSVPLQRLNGLVDIYTLSISHDKMPYEGYFPKNITKKLSDTNLSNQSKKFLLDFISYISYYFIKNIYLKQSLKNVEESKGMRHFNLDNIAKAFIQDGLRRYGV
ncbi:MAG: hypothetical protein JL50_11495 [Peptococcaceae bacterium BICA1-7]|nr:MAG: hypothetical protein JL50_11495 [Peptococcaceae bacterium BICA1-7]